MDPVDVDHGDADTALPDLTRLPLAELLASDNTALADALRRVAAELDDTAAILSGFGNVP
jgi:FXSXX-COOH protein